MDRIDLAQEREKWRAVVYAAIKFWVPQNGGNFVTS